MNDEILSIGLIGADGRMGKVISAIKDPKISLTFFNRFHPVNPSAQVDLFLDVSTTQALELNLQAALLSKKPIVIGTTGHLDLSRLQEAARSIPLFYSANFSLGMTLMQWAMKKFAQKFYRNATVKIIESHHERKKDAPSGSALRLAKLSETCHPAKVEIRSIRFGEIAGKHECYFDNDDEQLILTHEVKSRKAFAQGAILAARFLVHQSPGFYTMDDLLE